MKKKLSILIIFLHSCIFANMANPVQRGTLGGLPFVNEYVDIVHEDLFIKIDKNFQYATFSVKYFINSSKDGFQIPFLFYASEYLDSFSVKIDGKEVNVKKVPDYFKFPENTKFKDFSYFFEKSPRSNYSSILIKESPNTGFSVNLSDMIYFETDISKGQHLIEVSYRATKWTDRSGWVTKYSFRYALSPAKYWKSFGTLNIKIDATDFNKEITTNLGQPKKGDMNNISEWEFNKLPTEILQISFTPKISKTAQTLINIGPEKLAFISGGILAILHLILVIWYRKKYQFKRFSLVVIIGSLLIPLLFLLLWMYYYDIIDSFIGEHAGRTHGYTFFILGFYPIIMPVYWLIYWLIDKLIKKKYERQASV